MRPRRRAVRDSGHTDLDQKRYGYLIAKADFVKCGNFAFRTARAMHEPTVPVMPLTLAVVTRPVAPATLICTSAVPVMD